jgi:hypothetical protein
MRFGTCMGVFLRCLTRQELQRTREEKGDDDDDNADAADDASSFIMIVMIAVAAAVKPCSLTRAPTATLCAPNSSRVSCMRTRHPLNTKSFPVYIC